MVERDRRLTGSTRGQSVSCAPIFFHLTLYFVQTCGKVVCIFGTRQKLTSYRRNRSHPRSSRQIQFGRRNEWLRGMDSGLVCIASWTTGLTDREGYDANCCASVTNKGGLLDSSCHCARYTGIYTKDSRSVNSALASRSSLTGAEGLAKSLCLLSPAACDGKEGNKSGCFGNGFSLSNNQHRPQSKAMGRVTYLK